MAIADLDGDGYGDLATSNYLDNTVSVLLNDGDGAFAELAICQVDEKPYSVAMADLDGDGDAEFVAPRGYDH